MICMSTAAFPAHITVDDFLARPARLDGNYEELIEGIVYVSPNVEKRHVQAVDRLMERLWPLRKQGFYVFGEVAFRLTDYSLPNTDVTVVRRDRWDAVDDDDFMRESPDLAIEVASPSNRKMLEKAGLYIEHGAEQVWIVYPKSKRVLVLRSNDEDDQRRAGESLEFHGVQIALTDLFS